MQITVGDYLIARLKSLGIQSILGVPGDFNLQFLDQIEHSSGLDYVGCCNELNAAYAADGYARLHGISAAIFTYGVGDLSALNGIAGAAAEHVPVICIGGAPPLQAIRDREILHHTLGDGDYDNFMNCYAQICHAYTRLTPHNAATEIDRVLTAALHACKPVYIQLPSDISHITINVEMPEFPPQMTSASSERLESAVSDMLALWDQAERPAILADTDATRRGYADLLLKLAETTTTHYATTANAKAVLPETHPLSLGIYQGAPSTQTTREAIEKADCLVTTSPRFTELSSGLGTVCLPRAGLINLGHDHVSINGRSYHGVKPRGLLASFIDRLPGHADANTARCTEATENQAPAAIQQKPLSQDRLWPRLAAFIAPEDVVFAEVGTAGSGLGGQTIPAGVTYITAQIWSAIGYTLPALLGGCLAALERRQLLFIGDGSLQMTAQALSTLLRQQTRPIIFLINNNGYTVERCIHGADQHFNDIQPWDHQALLKAFGATDDQYLYLQASDESQLEKVLTTAADHRDRLVLIELHLETFDAPQGMKESSAALAQANYGPLGPQRRPNA